MRKLLSTLLCLFILGTAWAENITDGDTNRGLRTVKGRVGMDTNGVAVGKTWVRTAAGWTTTNFPTGSGGSATNVPVAVGTAPIVVTPNAGGTTNTTSFDGSQPFNLAGGTNPPPTIATYVGVSNSFLLKTGTNGLENTAHAAATYFPSNQISLYLLVTGTNGLESAAHAAATYFPSNTISSYLLVTGTNGLESIAHALATYFPSNQIGNYVTFTNNGAILVNGSMAVTNQLSIGGGVVGPTYIYGFTSTNMTFINPQIMTQTVTYAGTTSTINHASGTIVTMTLTNNVFIANPTSLVPGSFVYNLIEDSTGGRLPTWGSKFRWRGQTAPVAANFGTNANWTNSFSFNYDGINIRGSWDTNY